jgi:hypothetical protein
MVYRNLQRSLATAGILLLACGAFVACGQQAADHEGDDHAAMDHDEAAPAAAPAMAESTAPRVFFANVSDGDEVTSPVHLEFGIENFEIVKAQDPMVVEEGKGHHHLGVNTHCLEPGTLIEKAAPWIHFGDGGSSIDLQLPPGPAHLALQVGNGEHYTLDEPGLCAMISLNVVEGEAEGEAVQ